MPVLSDVVVTFLSSIVVLTPNGQCLDCAASAFSEPWDAVRQTVIKVTKKPTSCILRIHTSVCTLRAGVACDKTRTVQAERLLPNYGRFTVCQPQEILF